MVLVMKVPALIGSVFGDIEVVEDHLGGGGEGRKGREEGRGGLVEK
jgi:hypothetical protein